MDDILMMYVERNDWDAQRFISDFKKSECYMEPLTLEDGKEGTFLETRFYIENGQLRFRLKNDNEHGNKQVWRYHHHKSYAAAGVEFATLIACLRKVGKMASDTEEMYQSAIDKIHEFRQLAYPIPVLREACRILGSSSGEPTWFRVQHTLA